MKIVMFSPTWASTVGGTAKVARGLVMGLRAAMPSVDISVLSPDSDGPDCHGVSSVDGKILGSRLLYSIYYLWAVRPEIIHCHGRVHNLLAAYIYKKLFCRRGVRLVFSFYTQPKVKTFIPEIRDIVAKSNLSLLLKHKLSVFLLNRADVIVANSASLAKNVSKTFGFELSKQILVIPSGVDAPEKSYSKNDAKIFRAKYGLGDSSLVFMTVGVFSWDWKVAGILLLLRAFKRCISENISAKLVVVGDGNYRPLILDEIRKLSLENNVVLTGNLSDTFLALNAADIYCHLALNESCSVSIAEAMVMGKPIIVSNAGGNPEMITDGVTGVVVSPNVEDTALALKALAGNPDFWGKCGTAAMKAAEQAYGWGIIAGQYLKTYKSETN